VKKGEIALGSPQCRLPFYIDALANLNEVRDKLVKDIEDVLGLRVYLPDGLRIRIIQSIPRTSSTLVRGGYDPITKTIELIDGLWCRKTFIHELLHAISFFSHVHEVCEALRNEDEFIEGLTEFLTGYVLHSKYSNCYDEWILNRYPVCVISYERQVRLFGAVAQMLIPISDFNKIYVYDPQVNWFNKYERFLSNYGLEDFLINKPKKKRKIPLSILLENMVARVLRERLGEEKVDEFRELLHEAPLSEVLDYSKMKIIK